MSEHQAIQWHHGDGVSWINLYKIARLQQKLPKKVYLVLEWRTCKGQESSAVVAANRNTMSVLLVAIPHRKHSDLLIQETKHS